MSQILQVKNLLKNYNSFEAVKGISFDIKPGEIVGLLGPNGAGKTTTINMILGVLEPTSGKVEVLGLDLKHNREEILKQINFAAVYASLPGNMTVYENLYIFGLLYEVKNLKAVIAEQLKAYDLEKHRNNKVGVLSSGEQTRVALAKATINKPKLLLLDEPTASLDPSTARLVRDSMKEYVKKNNTAILWTSHNMHEVEEVCDRVMFLSHGQILLQGVPRDLVVEHNKKNLEELFITVAREPLSLSE